MKTILVTGGQGFIGRNLVEHLSKNGFYILSLDKSKREWKGLKNVGYVYKDIRNSILSGLPKIDIVIHCAADPCVLSGVKNPTNMIDNNFLGTINCLEVARRDKADFIFISSSRVYPIKDNIRSLYGASKLCSEIIIAEYAKMYDFKYIINRLGLTAGKYQSSHINQGVVSYWIKQHLENGELNYVGFGGKGEQIRDVLHVDDLCELMSYQINNIDKLNRSCYDVGGGIDNSFTLKELTEMVHQMTGCKIDVGSVPETRESDTFCCLSDNRDVYKLTGWKPKRTLRNVVSDVYNWLKKGE